jgi:hypothetical protein
LFALLAGCISVGCLSAQDGPAKGKALNIPTKRYFLSFGNSLEFNGLRFNIADRDVRRINGINITLWAGDYQSWFSGDQFYTSEVNGISAGVMPTGGILRGLNLGAIRVAASKNLTGLSLGGLNVFANGSINGISLSSLITQGGRITGVALSGIAVGGTGGINGVAFGGLAVSSDRSDINGIATSVAVVFCGNELNGIGISGLYLKAGSLTGIAVSGYTNTNQTNGLTIALFNYTQKLNGLQLGILNYAGNNRRGLRLLPLLNVHLKDN